MKMLVWAFPATALVIQLFDEQVDPVLEQQVWMDDLVPTVITLSQTHIINEVLVIGPISFTEHIQDMIQQALPNIPIILGEK